MNTINAPKQPFQGDAPEPTLRDQLQYVLNSLEDCRNVTERLEDAINGPQPRGINAGGGIVTSNQPRPQPSLTENASLTLTAVNEMRNRLERLAGAIGAA